VEAVDENEALLKKDNEIQQKFKGYFFDKNYELNNTKSTTTSDESHGIIKMKNVT